MSGYEYPNLSNTKEIELCKVVYGEYPKVCVNLQTDVR